MNLQTPPFQRSAVHVLPLKKEPATLETLRQKICLLLFGNRFYHRLEIVSLAGSAPFRNVPDSQQTSTKSRRATNRAR